MNEKDYYSNSHRGAGDRWAGLFGHQEESGQILLHTQTSRNRARGCVDGSRCSIFLLCSLGRSDVFFFPTHSIIPSTCRVSSFPHPVLALLPTPSLLAVAMTHRLY